MFPIARFFKRIGTRSNEIYIFEWYLLGDLIMALDAIFSIRKNFPDKRIVLFIDHNWMALQNNLDFLDEVVGVKCPWSPSKKKKFFQALVVFLKLMKPYFKNGAYATFSFRGDLRDHFLQGLIPSQKKFGLAYTGFEYLLTNIYFNSFLKQVDRNNGVLKSQGFFIYECPYFKKILGFTNKYIIGCFFARHSERNYPVSQALELKKMLKKAGFTLMLIAPSKSANNFEDFIGFTFENFVSCLSNAAYFIGVDSGPSHLVAKFNIPSIILYLKGRKKHFLPKGKDIYGIESKSAHTISDIEPLMIYDLFIKKSNLQNV